MRPKIKIEFLVESTQFPSNWCPLFPAPRSLKQTRSFSSSFSPSPSPSFPLSLSLPLPLKGLCCWATRLIPLPLPSRHPPQLATVLTSPLSFHQAWIPPKSTRRCSTHMFRTLSRHASAPPPRNLRYWRVSLSPTRNLMLQGAKSSPKNSRCLPGRFRYVFPTPFLPHLDR